MTHKFAVHGEDAQGNTDYFVIEDEDIEVCKQTAVDGTNQRQWKNCWSERL